MSNQPEPAGYAEALAELEAILSDLESADVDVDVLATRVQRATHLIAFCRERLAGFKTPKHVVFSDLPKTSTGKIQKFELRAVAKLMEKT